MEHVDDLLKLRAPPQRLNKNLKGLVGSNPPLSANESFSVYDLPQTIEFPACGASSAPLVAAENAPNPRLRRFAVNFLCGDQIRGHDESEVDAV